VRGRRSRTTEGSAPGIDGANAKAPRANPSATNALPQSANPALVASV
jgi:hypothetical protein